MKKLNKSQKGITLIALVITIIVLIILAGVSISVLSGENGLLEKFSEAKEKNLIASEREKIELAYLKCTTIQKEDDKYAIDDLLENELKNDNVSVFSFEEDKNEELIYITFNNTNNMYLINEKGTVTYIEDNKADTSKIDEKLVLQTLNYTDDAISVSNPDRGFYKRCIVSVNNNLFDIQSGNLNEFCTITINRHRSIVQVLIDLSEFSGNANSEGIDKNITNEQIESLNRLLDVIRKRNLNVIVRCTYSVNGQTGKEPKSFDTIVNHIQQLSSFYYTNKDIISTVEAGFLGPYGEMHSAGVYQKDEYYKKLIETLLDNTPNNITINVRKPHYYRIVANNLDFSQKRIGIFNDGYLGSATDLGTFDSETTRENFVNWMQTHGKYTLYGGEATKFDVNSSAYKPEDEQYSEGSFAIGEMEKTHTTYLNSDFNLLILTNKWEQEDYNGEDTEYSGTKVYKYINDHLGYRLVLRESNITPNVNKGDIAGVNLKIENVGFGNIVKKQRVSVILSKNDQYYEAPLNINANNINCKETTDLNFYFYVPSDISAGDWDVYLKICNRENYNYSIKFVNEDVWNEDILANKLGKITIGNEITTENIKFKQAFRSGAKDRIEQNANEVNEETKNVSVRLDFYDETSRVKVNSIEKYVKLGTEIKFKDDENMASLGIKIPDGYKFLYSQCRAITGTWDGYDSIKIPEKSDTQGYNILVYLKEKGLIQVSIAFYDKDSKMIKTTPLNLKPGTTINFLDENNLSNLGIELPENTTFNFAQCYAITNDWNGYNSITIPNETTATSFWINVFVK